jgi:hypothetical protein
MLAFNRSVSFIGPSMGCWSCTSNGVLVAQITYQTNCASPINPMFRWRANSQWSQTGGHFTRDFSNPTDRKVPMSVKQGFFPPIESTTSPSPTSLQQSNALLRM